MCSCITVGKVIVLLQHYIKNKRKSRTTTSNLPELRIEKTQRPTFLTSQSTKKKKKKHRNALARHISSQSRLIRESCNKSASSICPNPNAARSLPPTPREPKATRRKGAIPAEDGGSSVLFVRGDLERARERTTHTRGEGERERKKIIPGACCCCSFDVRRVPETPRAGGCISRAVAR